MVKPNLSVVRNNEATTTVDGGSEPPDNGDMEARVAKLELIAEKTSEKLSAIERDLAVLKTEASHYATKADVANAKNSIVMWVVSAILLAQLLPALLAKLTQ